MVAAGCSCLGAEVECGLAEPFLAAKRLFQGLVANSPGLKYDRS